MKTMKSRIKRRFAQAFSLMMVLVLILGAGTANAATVSGAAVPPIPSSNYNFNISISLQSFQLGNWAYSDESPESPAWKEFSSKLRHDNQGVMGGDSQNTFDTVLTPAGLNMEVCQRSSVIWMTRDTSRVTSYTINKHTNWNQGMALTGNPNGIARVLEKAPVIGGTSTSANLSAIAEEVANHPSITAMVMPEMKVICSAQFSDKEPTGTGAPFEECVGDECDPGNPPTEAPPAKSGLCTSDEEGVWRGRKLGGADPLGNASEGQLALALFPYDGLSAIHAIAQGAAQGAAGATGNLPFENVLRWRCTTRYMSYYQFAPATYNTRTTLANVRNDETGHVGNVFDLIQKRTGQNFKTNSSTGKAWYDGMKLVSGLNDIAEVGGYLSEALSVESGLTKTGYADKWK